MYINVACHSVDVILSTARIFLFLLHTILICFIYLSCFLHKHFVTHVSFLCILFLIVLLLFLMFLFSVVYYLFYERKEKIFIRLSVTVLCFVFYLRLFMFNCVPLGDVPTMRFLWNSRHYLLGEHNTLCFRELPVNCVLLIVFVSFLLPPILFIHCLVFVLHFISYASTLYMYVCLVNVNIRNM